MTISLENEAIITVGAVRLGRAIALECASFRGTLLTCDVLGEKL